MALTKEYLRLILTSCMNAICDMDDRNFHRGLNGFTLAVTPFPGEAVPATWENAMLRYEREFPPEGKSFYNTFERDQREVYQQVYGLLVDNVSVVHANTEYFIAFLDGYAERMA